MVGYLYKNKLFLGGGIGAEYLLHRLSGNSNDLAKIRIPVFIAPKYTLHVSETASFHAQIDTGFYIYTKSDPDNPQTFFLIPKIGVGFKCGEHSRLNLSIGFSEDKTNKIKYTGLHIGVAF